MKYYAFGHGIGSVGAEARKLGFYGLTDSNYIKIFFETGLCGSLGFILVMMSTVARAFSYIKYYICELSIVLFILVAMPISNSLCLYHLCILPFWYAVGRIWNNDYLMIAQKLNIRI